MSCPIKYAVEELKVDGGYQYDYEGITKGFIVSKCYVLEDRFSYTYCNIIGQNYIVSFPYDRFSNFLVWYNRNSKNYRYDLYKYYFEEQRNPDKEYQRDEYPCHIVSALFDTYEEAKELADSNNNYLKNELLENTGKAAYERLSEEFKNTMNICGEYEKFIYNNTQDMEITMYEYSSDSEALAKLLNNFEYDPIKIKEIIQKYQKLTTKFNGPVKKLINK